MAIRGNDILFEFVRILERGQGELLLLVGAVDLLAEGYRLFQDRQKQPGQD